MADWVISSIIYILSLTFLTAKNLSFPLGWDRLGEYRILESKLKGEAREELLSHCLLVFLPAYILRRWLSPMMVFRLTPGIVHAMAPAFLYLVVRQEFPVHYALLAPLLLISNPFFFFYSDTGRVGMSLGLMAGAFWSMTTGSNWLALAFLLVLIITYPGATQFTLFVIGGAWLSNLLLEGLQVPIYALFITSVYIWQNFITKRVSVYIMSFTESTLSNDWIKARQLTKRIWLNIESRDPVVKSAFQVPKTGIARIEWLLSWAIALIVTAGVLYSFRFGVRDLAFLHLLGLWAYLTILMAIFVPQVSFYFGLMRTVTLAMIFLAPLIVNLAVGLNIVGLVVGILVLYGLVVSGLFHPLFKVDKYFQLRVYDGNR